MRRTPDVISKKRKKLRQNLDLYNLRMAEIQSKLDREILFTSAERAQATEQIRFCQAEISKSREALAKLSRGTPAQRAAGW
jgi:hypothetical protein